MRGFSTDKRLKFESVFTLPYRLIDCIQKHVSELWSDEDVRFERWLRNRHGTGLYRGSAFLSETVEGDLLGLWSQDADFDFRRKSPLHGLVRQWWENRFVAHMIDGGRAMPSRESFQRDERQLRQRTRHYMRAYLGWLVSNAAFRRESIEFLDRNHRMLNQLGLPDFESVNEQLRSPRIRSSERVRMLHDAWILLQKWCLRQLWTPELPEPIGAQLLADDDLSEQPQKAWVMVFLPWPLTRGPVVELSILENLQLTRRDNLSHLDSWLRSASATWGTIRYERMLDLHLYRFQALVQRYPDRLERRTEKLDAAFAEYWNTDPANLRPMRDGAQCAKLVRLEYLKRCAETVPAPTDSSNPNSGSNTVH